MKFLSFKHAVVIVCALLLSNLLFSENAFVRHAGAAVLIYALYMLNWRLQTIQEKLGIKELFK
jgi:hypothetical protein